MIKLKRLKELIHYNPDTGEFIWRQDRINACKGSSAGSITKFKNGKSYMQISIDRHRLLLHRVAWLYMTGEEPEYHIDHIDGDGCNNKWGNLREATSLVNSTNKRKYCNNSTGVTGVNIESGRYRATIRYNKTKISLGMFNNIFDATCARKSAENRLRFHENHGSVRPL